MKNIYWHKVVPVTGRGHGMKQKIPRNNGKNTCIYHFVSPQNA